MKKYALLIGVKQKEDYLQKSLCEIYSFLKSERGGAWRGNEIAILPNGCDNQSLNFLLRRIIDYGTDFLFLYFCGDRNDFLTNYGFMLGGIKIKKSAFENICKSQITIFDSCDALIPDDFFFSDEAEFCDENNDENDKCKNDEYRLKDAELKAENYFLNLKRELYLTGCKNGFSPQLLKDGGGLYTNALLKHLALSDGALDFKAADKNARFECEIAQEAQKKMKNYILKKLTVNVNNSKK